MMDQIGKLSIAQARLLQIADELSDHAISKITEQIQRLVTCLRDAKMSIRMLPIEPVFSKFWRVVRDLSSELGKSDALIFVLDVQTAFAPTPTLQLET